MVHLLSSTVRILSNGAVHGGCFKSCYSRQIEDPALDAARSVDSKGWGQRSSKPFSASNGAIGHSQMLRAAIFDSSPALIGTHVIEQYRCIVIRQEQERSA